MTEKPTKVKRPGRRAGRLHEELRKLGRHQWHPELVGVIANYPPTPEAYAARQQHSREHMARMRAEGRWKTRRGVPDGYGGGKAGIARRARAAAQELAERIWSHLVTEYDMKPDEYAKASFVGAAEIVLAKDDNDAYVYTTKDRLVAIRLLADFHAQKPETKSKITVAKPEDWLAALADETAAK